MMERRYLMTVQMLYKLDIRADNANLTFRGFNRLLLKIIRNTNI